MGFHWITRVLTQVLSDLIPMMGAQVDPQRRETAFSSSAYKTVSLEETLTITATCLLAKTDPPGYGGWS